MSNLFAGSVSEIDVITNTLIDTADVGTAPTDGAFDGTDLWVTIRADDSVVETITVGDGPGAITYDGTDVWVASAESDFVSRITPA